MIIIIKKAVIFIVLITLFILPSYAACVGDTVSVGGMAFGIKFYTDGVLICGVSEVDTKDGNVSPGDIAELKKGDIITKIDGNNIADVKDILNILKNSEGKPLTLKFTRADKSHETTITPVRSCSEDSYKLGLWLKDGTAGIGTVTYIEDNGSFAGLGHGVCDAESGELMKMREGEVTDVTITGIKISTPGDPGQIQGFFADENGSVSKNTLQGVYGSFDTKPHTSSKAIIASKKDIAEGPATILCTLNENTICQYNIKIEKINHNNDNTKNFVIKVCDEDLLKKTGGIVQGMSGSPILQNGKLIGAVTHVLVDDPTRGYGIFIENMLESA